MNFIQDMFARTKNGALTLTHYPEDGSQEFNCTYQVDWDEQKAEALEKQFQELCNNLKLISLLHDTLQPFLEAEKTPRCILNADMLAVWDTYIAPFGNSGLDAEAVANASGKRFHEEPLTEAEEALLTAHRNWFEQQCAKRLPCRSCSSVGLITRARRYERLVRLRAPKIVIENEARCLAEELVLYYCMTS